MSDTSKAIRILLVDDHLVVRRGLASLIDDEADLSVVAEAGSGEAALKMLGEISPDVAILDLRLPGMSGIDIARRIKADHPEVQLMILSSYLQEEDVRQAFQTGVLAYLVKDSSSEELLRAIREVAAGQPFLPAEVSLLLARSTGRDALTERELEVLRLIARGQANKEIGDRLSVSENTVKNHVKSILGKLGARDRTQAVTEALKRGLFRLESD